MAAPCLGLAARGSGGEAAGGGGKRSTMIPPDMAYAAAPGAFVELSGEGSRLKLGSTSSAASVLICRAGRCNPRAPGQVSCRARRIP